MWRASACRKVEWGKRLSHLAEDLRRLTRPSTHGGEEHGRKAAEFL
ncbi:MAG: hypothetical protein ACO2PN_05485 [Pyrobaculum sp.]